MPQRPIVRKKKKARRTKQLLEWREKQITSDQAPAEKPAKKTAKKAATKAEG